MIYIPPIAKVRDGWGTRLFVVIVKKTGNGKGEMLGFFRIRLRSGQNDNVKYSLRMAT
jgi:hypothetical protein